MPTFRATSPTGDVSQYDAETPDPTHLGAGWRLEEIIVVAPAPEADPPPPTVYEGRRRLTHQEFLNLLGVAFVPILALAKQSVEIEAWVMRFQVATPDESGYPINLDDPLTIQGLNALEPILVAQGVVQIGWAQGVLNG